MITLDSITLPENLHWLDEYDWSPVEQATQYSLTGALLVDEDTKQAGRPITLTTPDNGGWATRATVDSLRAKLQANTDMTLTLHDGREFTVRWRHGGQALNAEPVYPGLANPQDDDLYRLRLQFIEV